MSEAAARQAVADLLDRSVEAWDRNDADAYAALFTQDCTYIAFFGGIYRGRAEVASSHRVLFAGPLKGTKLFVETVEIRPIGEDTALLVTRGDTATKKPAKLKKVQSYLAVRQADGWRFAHFQNTKTLVLMRYLTYRAGPEAIPSLDQ